MKKGCLVIAVFAVAFSGCRKAHFRPDPRPEDGCDRDPGGTVKGLDSATVLGCPGGTCGGNSPFVNAFPVIGVHAFGCKNSEGVSLAASEVNFSDSAAECLGATRLGFRDNRTGYGWELVGRNAAGNVVPDCTGTALVGAEFSFHKGNHVARVKILRVGLIESRRSLPSIGYVLADPAPVVDDSMPSNRADAVDAAEPHPMVQSDPPVVIPVPIPIPVPPVVSKMEWPSLCDPMESQEFRKRLEAVEQQPAQRRRPTLKPRHGGLSVLDGEDAGAAIVILEGEVYDGAADVKGKAGRKVVPGWFNFACAKDGMGKLFLERGVRFDANENGVRRRQTMLRMETALYCKSTDTMNIHGYTTRGVRIDASWRHRHSPGSNPVEAYWNENGARCIDIPRVFSSNRSVQRSVLPEGCSDQGCDKKSDFLEQLNKECGFKEEDEKIKYCDKSVDVDGLLQSRIADYPQPLPSVR